MFESTQIAFAQMKQSNDLARSALEMMFVHLKGHKSNKLVIANLSVLIFVCLLDDQFKISWIENTKKIFKCLKDTVKFMFCNKSWVVFVEEGKSFSQLLLLQIESCTNHGCLELTEFDLLIIVGVQHVEKHDRTLHGYVVVANSLPENQIEFFRADYSILIFISLIKLLLYIRQRICI